MATPNSNPTGPKNIHLTTQQGLLMVAGLVIFFGGIFYWIANRYPSSYEGTLTLTDSAGTSSAFAPFGCTSDELRPRMSINLRPEPAPEGFHEENRALIVEETSGTNFTSTPAPAATLNFRFRQQDKTEIAANCTVSEQTLTVQDYRVRRRNRPDITKHRWNGDLKGTCTTEAGELAFGFTLQNCD
jgi:hypothetical protein